MRNFTSQKLRILFLIGFFLTCLTAIAQTPVPPGFAARLPGGSIRVKGDVVFVGNNILNRSPNPNTAYDGNTDNNGQTMEYIDIDGDPSTRNSSSANLTLASCDRVVYAGLYWASTYPYERSTDNGSEWNPSDANRYSDFNQIKFKLPTGGYIDLTGTILFDGRATVLNQSFKDAPAICYTDVTSLVQGLATPTGTYTLGNMRSSKGQRAGSSSAGWVMVVIYENPTLPSKFISTYDGYKGVTSGSVDIPISGFVTLPSPNPVNARLGVGALEGDKGLTGDKLQFKGNLNATYTDIGNTLNPTDNFFNSTITNNNAQVPGRNPYGQNTLGLDLDMLPINNPSNTIIKNNETGATLRLSSSGDGFGAFLATFAVDIIEPNIKLVKKVQNSSGVDISGQNVTLSSILDYVVTFDNIGNDDAKNLVIKDILPVNTSFVSISMPTITAAGGTYSYNAATGTITINVPNSLVLKDALSVEHTIKIRVKVASSCNELTDACSSIIRNSAFATYQGVINTSLISDNPSAAGLTSCGAPLVGPANFLVDVSACVYSRSEVLCNGSLVLTGGDGYGTYTWYKENGAVDIPMGTTQSITVNDTGVYYYDATPIAPCIVPIHETITVTNFTGVTLTNPVIAVADVSPICPNNGVPFPKIFLCGNTDSQFIPTGISSGIVRWQKLGAGCTTVVPTDCPHQTCPSDWTTIFTGPDYTVTDAGEYRIAYDADGSGSCMTYFYFYVSKNNYTPNIAVKDIVCTTNGEIRVTNAPANYQIKFINQTTNTVLVDYPNTNPVLAVTTPGAYAVEIRQTGVANGCIFRVNDITVLSKSITANVITVNKTCSIPGSITVQPQGVNPPYSYTLTGPATLTYGPDTTGTHTFSGLIPGTYAITVTTPDGCTYNGSATVVDFSNPILNAAVTQSPTNCDPGVITITPSGGSAPYTFSVYTINGAAQPLVYFPENTYSVPVANTGTYVFTMTDNNNCTVLSNPVTISNIIPVVTQAKTDVKCNGGTTGTITVSATGTGISYQLLNSASTVIATNTSGNFTGLAAGSYTVNVIQTGTTTTCTYPYPFTLTQPVALADTASVTTPLTCNPAGATITAANATGGTAPYTYSINGTTFGTSQVFTGLTAGTYSVTVKDANDCTYVTAPMTLTAPTPVTNINFAATAVTCPAVTSNVTLTPVGGQAPYNYSITSPTTVNNGTSATFASLAPGTYTFTVTDAKGCSYSKNYTINNITPISVVGTKVNDVRCYGTATGALTYTVSGFSPNYNYTVASTGTAVAPATGVTSGTINLTNLAAGTYTITVTSPTTNCTATAAVTIANPTAALAVTKTVVQPNCITTTGSLTVAASNGWGGYQYGLTGAATVGPQASPNFTGLAAGNYTLTVTDANGCIFTDTFTLTAPVVPVLAVTASDLCLPGTSITVAVNAGTGLAPFQFSLNGGAYANGTVANGTTYTGLAAGTYTITVKDANGCTNATTVTRTINAQLTASTAINKGITCSVPTAAQIGVTIGGGAAPYQYQVSFNGGAYSALTATGGATFTYNAAAAGNYQFQITDAAGCTVTTAPRTVAPITNPQFTFGPTTAVKCYGDNTGALTVNITPGFGAPSYTVAVTNTTTSTPYGSQTTLLPAGNYSVTVTDSNGCSVTHTTTITQPTAPIAYTVVPKDITCNNPTTSFGEIKIENLTGGTAPFTYYVSNNFGTNLTPYVATTGEDHTFIVVNFGIYTVNVVDANGCSLIKTNYVIASPPSDLNIDITAPTADCTTGGTVTVTVTAAVLSNNYEFGILTQSTVPYSTAFQTYNPGTPTIKTFTGLTPGVTYTFVVHDLVTDCYYFKTATGPVPTLSSMTATATPTNVTCTGAADGKVSFTVSGYSATTTQVDYEIFRYPSTLPVAPTPITGSFTGLTGAPATVNNLGNLAPGDYYILFTEVDGSVMGCSKTSPVFKITESTLLLQASAVVTKNDNCNTNAGIITASAQYGTAPYSYQLLPAASPAPTVATWAGQPSPIFNAEGGTYLVYVKDANNCIRPTPANVVLPTDVSPALTAVITPGTQCTTEGNFSIDVTRTNNGSIGPFLYSLDGGAFQAEADSFSYTGLSSGTHTIQIQDINGCTMATAVSVPVFAPLNVTAQPTVQPTCPANVGTITAVGAGGSAPANLRYELQTAAGVSVAGPQASPVFTGVVAGNYKVVISDTSTTCTEEAAVTLDATIPVTFTTTKDDVNCNGGTDGSITITLPASNTDIQYTYTIDGALSAAVTQNTPVFTGLAADIYDVTVTSGKNCSLTTQVTITEPLTLDSTASITTAFACAQPANTVNTATVTVSEVAGTGTAPYTYSIDGTNYTTTNAFAVANPTATQNLTTYVKDSNGCIDTFVLSITPMPAITSATALLTTAIECDDDQGVITVTAVGGSGDFTFKMEPAGTPVNTAAGTYSETFTITEPGNYTFTITDDVTGCTTSVSAAEVMEYDLIAVTATASTPVVCFGDDQGTITINVQNYTGAYSYEVFEYDSVAGTTTSVTTGTGNTSVNPFTVPNVSAGTMFVTVTATGSPYCSADTNNITVDSPTDPLVPNAAMTANVTCTNDKGEITALATGGWGGYEYELVNTTTSAILVPYSANNVFTGLVAGTYTVNVKDSGNCIVGQTLSLTVPPSITATTAASVSLLLCNGDTTATLTATASNGQGTYEYVLNTYDATGTTIVSSTGAQASNAFTGLGAGIYSVTVTDGWGCGPLETNTVTITEPTPIVGSLSITTSLTCTNPAVLTLTATGGTSPYQYSTDGGTIYTPFAGPVTFNVTAGTYQYLVKDANNCTAVLTNEAEVPVIQPLAVNLDLTAAVISCHGGNNATITANATGGLGNYQYELLNASNVVISGPTTNGSFSGLSAGTYSVHVISGDCNTTSLPQTIVDPAELLSVPTITHIQCFGQATGSISFATTGGTPIVQYAVSPNLSQFNDVNVLTQLTAGFYDVIVQDARGCFILFEDLEITQPGQIEAEITVHSDERCLGSGDGTIDVHAWGGTPPYQISTDNTTYTTIPGTYDAITGATYQVTGLEPGTTLVWVRDDNGCSIFPAMEQEIKAGVNMDPQVTVVETCVANAPNNNVTINVTLTGNPDGNLSYITYSIDGTTYQASNVFNNVSLPAGTYTAYAKHTMPGAAPVLDRECIQTHTFTIAAHNAIAATAAVTDPIDCNGGTGEITINVTSSTGTLQYAIGPLFTFGSSNVFGGLTASATGYDFKVRDVLGCEFDITGVVLTEPTVLTAAISGKIDEICFGDDDGTFTVTPSGGTADYQVSIDNGVTFTALSPSAVTFTDLSAGSYTVVVKDANNCTYTVPTAVTIADGANLLASIDPVQDCNVMTITVDVNPLEAANVTYYLDGVAQPSNVITATGLTAGNHTIDVTHTNGCNANFSFTVAPIVPIVMGVTSHTNVNCFGGTDGTATVTVTGGTAPLTYAIAPNVLPLVYGPYQSSNTFTGLAAGDYVINVKDAIDCDSPSVTITITQPAAALSATATDTDEICITANDGTITVTPTDGTAPYRARINGGAYTATFPTSHTFTALAPGNYTVDVIDANNCTYSLPAAINIATGADLQPSVIVDPYCQNNVIHNIVLISDGNFANIGLLEYAVDGGTYQANGDFLDLAPGTHTASVRHNNGCVETIPFTVPNLSAISASVTATANVGCFGESTGAITVTATGGTGTLSYAIADADVLPLAFGTYQATGVFNGLTEGNYVVSILDDNLACETQVTATLTQPAAPLAATAGTQTDVLCYGNATGSATVNVTGGTAAYTYSWNTTPVQTTATATGLIAGTYTVTVTDANLCTTTQSFTITQPAAPLSAAVGATQTDVLCFGAATGSATVNVTGGTTAYTYSWNTTPVQTTATATGLVAGTYTVTVTDANLCTTTQSFTITEPAAPLTATAGTQTNVLCFGNATGDATVNVTGGTGAYTYSWNTTPVQTTATATGLIAGTYTVTVTDANLCTTTQSFTITEPAAPLSAAVGGTQTDVLCYGNATGSATVNVTGGTGAYTYSWNTTPVQTTATATGLTAGTYTVTVTDANLCTTTQSFTITQPAAPLTATAGTQTNVLCYGNATGSATVNVTGGTTAYSYSWNTTPVQTTATATGLIAGTYTVTVTDANLCTTTQSFTITQPAAPLSAAVGATQTDVLCFGAATGSATVNVTGGTAAYTYSWNTTPVQTTATATGLVAGTYTVTVTDANLCTTTQSFTITQPAAALAATAGTQTNILCFGNATGDATVNVTGGTGAYTYSWNTTPVQTTATATGLTAGTYTVTVTDANLCTTTQSFTITQPAAPLSAATGGTQTNILCYGNATGSATVNVTGGTGAYTYSWNTTPVQTTATATGLVAGTYTVTVTDANLCTTTQSFTITQPAAPLTATAGTQTNVLCYGNATGSATVNVTGGTTAYSYSWNTTPVQTTATATGLTAGTYTVTVTDANLCTTTQSFTITQPAAPLSAATGGTQTDILCFGAATGSATVNVTGGTGTYTYSWNTTPVQTTATATGLTAGTYIVTVTDANLCTTTQSFTITQPAAALTATAGTQTNILCFGNATGLATVNVTGGTGAYTYSWNTTPVQTTATATGLTAGTYTVTVTDANLCTTTQSFTITQPAAPLSAATGGTQTNVLCFGGATGSATVNVTGGTAAYTYSWNTTPVQTTATATGLTAGTYTVTVTDANLCTTTQSFTITQPATALTAAAGTQTNVLCFGAATGSATIVGTGGTGAYTYSWNTTPVQTTATATGLTAGTYTGAVTDANGCSANVTFTISQPTTALSATATHTNEICLSAGNGTITVTPSGGTAPYEARINTGIYTAPSVTPITFTALAPGNYTVEVRDANGCTYTVPAAVTITPGVNIQPSIVANQVCNTTTVTLSANPAIPAANLTYSLDGGASQAFTTSPIPFTGLTAGNHSIVITHSNGCNSAPLNFNVAPVIPIVIGATSHTDALCFGGATGTATVTATGGTAPLSYAIAPNVLPLVYGTYQASNTFTGLTAGDYVINVKDALGCESATTVINIAQPVMALSAIATHTDEQCLNEANGSITVTPQGGTALYSASLNGGAFTAPTAGPINFPGLTGGTYNIVVRDANGCTVPVTATVLTGIVINPHVSYTQECNEVDVVVSVNAAVVGQVTYSLDGGPAQTSNEFNNVILNPAVQHIVTVTHVQGCSQDTQPFTIAPVIPINLNAANVNVTNIACHGKDVGSIVANATGGTGTLQYAITWNIWPTPIYTTSNTFNDLLAGDYTIHVKDAMGCHEQITVTITEPAEELLITAAVGQHESCAGAHDGSINITMVQGGTPPYSIALDSPINFQPYDPAATPDFVNLYGRTLPYEVYVRDASGCYAKAIVTIEKGVNLVPNIQTVLTCVNNAPVNTVTATLNAVINNVEYKLETATGTLIQDFSTVHTWTLAPGNYVYTVRHINGCQKTFAFTVQPRVPITVTSVIPTDAACNGATNGTLTVTATGGSGNLQYGISPDFVMTSNPVFTGLAAGTYTVRVQDQYGCYVDFTNFPAVGEPAVIAVTDVMNLPEACIDDNDGAFEIDITGGTAPYATSLDANGPFVADQTLFDNLDGGIYTVYIQDANGCTTTHEVTLISPLDIDAKAEVVYNCDQNTVTILTNGDINPVELNYSITGPKDGNNPPQTSNVFANLEDGSYTVEVVNTVTGCTDTTTFTIVSVPDLAISLSMSGLNQFQANVMGGEGPYQYTLNGDSNGSKNVFTYFSSGVYVVTVTDSRGCTKEARIEVNFVDIILPDVVSPDGNGQNDTWAPGNTANYPHINTFVFDRYGRKLATLRQGDVWDGTYDGNPMPTGDYWYLIELGDAEGRSFVGHFTIYR